MFYLILQMLLCLIIAAILGFILGWLIKSWLSVNNITNLKNENKNLSDDCASLTADCSRLRGERDHLLEKTFDIEASASSKAVGDESEIHSGSYEVTEIEGIGKGYGKKLNSIGIKTTKDLLEKGKSSSGVKEIAKAVGNMELSVVHKWLSMANLINIPGIRGQFAELLEASGIDSPAALARQDARSLTTKMADVNARENRTRTNPTVEMTTIWIQNANKLKL